MIAAVATIFTSVDFWTFVGVVAGIFTIFALGLQLQFGFTGLLNFGHVAFMAVGAYTMAILVVKVGWPMWAAALAAIGMAMAFGVLIGLPTVRLRADFLAIATHRLRRESGSRLLGPSLHTLFQPPASVPRALEHWGRNSAELWTQRTESTPAVSRRELAA